MLYQCKINVKSMWNQCEIIVKWPRYGLYMAEISSRYDSCPGCDFNIAETWLNRVWYGQDMFMILFWHGQDMAEILLRSGYMAGIAQNLAEMLMRYI